MIYGFDGKSLDNPPLERCGVKKDGGTFDQLTGATITSRAIVKAVKKTLQYYREHREALFAEAKAPVQGTAIPGRIEGNNPGEERQP